AEYSPNVHGGIRSRDRVHRCVQFRSECTDQLAARRVKRGDSITNETVHSGKRTAYIESRAVWGESDHLDLCVDFRSKGTDELPRRQIVRQQVRTWRLIGAFRRPGGTRIRETT